MNDPFSPRNSNYTLVSFRLVSYLNCSVRGKTIKPPLSDKEKDSQRGRVVQGHGESVHSGRAGSLTEVSHAAPSPR